MNITEIATKVRKLLAMGNDKASTPEESAAFLAKAQRIIDEHKLDVSSFDYDENQEREDAEPIVDFGYEDPLDNVKYGQYRETWTRRLAAIVSHHNQCRTVYITQFDKSVVIKIIGRPSDVQTVRYMYGFFKRQVEDLSAEACRGHSSAFRGQFCMGVLDTLYGKLNRDRQDMFAEKRKEHAANSMALIRVNTAIVKMEKRALAVEAFVKDSMKNLRNGRAYHAKTYTGGRTAGQKAGEKIRLTGAKAAVGSGVKSLPPGK